MGEETLDSAMRMAEKRRAEMERINAKMKKEATRNDRLDNRRYYG